MADDGRDDFVRSSILIALFAVGICGCKEAPMYSESEFFEPIEMGSYAFDGEPRLVAPDRLFFGEVEVGDNGSRSLVIENAGRGRLEIVGWELEGPFDLQREEPFPLVIPRGGSSVLTVSYAPLSGALEEGMLVLQSNDPERPAFPIRLIGNERLPCLLVMPSEPIDFGMVEPGETRRRGLEARNCSTNTLTTLAVRMRGAHEFSAGSGWPSSEVVLEPEQSIDLEVLFSPTTTGGFYGAVIIESDDYIEPRREIDLRGRCAYHETCPTPGEGAGITPWQTYREEAPICYGRRFSSHGDPAQFEFAALPDADDPRWAAVPENRTGFAEPSTLCGRPCSCLDGGDFTYFQAFFYHDDPASLSSVRFFVGNLDDGALLMVFNARFPDGKIVGHANLWSSLDHELAELLAPGENRLALIHLDDCCQERRLGDAQVTVDGDPVPLCPL